MLYFFGPTCTSQPLQTVTEKSTRRHYIAPAISAYHEPSKVQKIEGLRERTEYVPQL